MYTILVVLHVIVAILLIIIVLLQTGRAGSIGSIFGSGSDQLFSTPSGTALIRKTTIIIAAIFFITTIGLTFLSYRKGITTVTSQTVPTQP